MSNLIKKLGVMQQADELEAKSLFQNLGYEVNRGKENADFVATFSETTLLVEVKSLFDDEGKMHTESVVHEIHKRFLTFNLKVVYRLWFLAEPPPNSNYKEIAKCLADAYAENPKAQNLKFECSPWVKISFDDFKVDKCKIGAISYGAGFDATHERFRARVEKAAKQIRKSQEATPDGIGIVWVRVHALKDIENLLEWALIGDVTYTIDRRAGSGWWAQDKGRILQPTKNTSISAVIAKRNDELFLFENVHAKKKLPDDLLGQFKRVEYRWIEKRLNYFRLEKFEIDGVIFGEV